MLTSMLLRLWPIVATSLLIAGCDMLGLGPDPRIAQREADGRAIGAACRHALRGIEDCYRLNERPSKTAIFEGWKEMDQYMRENKLEGSPSTVASKSGSDEVMLADKQSETGGSSKKTSTPAAKP